MAGKVTTKGAAVTIGDLLAVFERRAREHWPSLRELAAKHGLDFEAADDQQEELDLLTGKRESLEGQA